MPTVSEITFTAQDQAAVRAIFDSAIRYMKARDWTGFAQVFTENAVAKPARGPLLTGRRNIQAWGQAFPPFDDYSLQNLEVRGDGNLAYATCGYAIELKGKAAEIGSQLTVLRRSAPEAPWKIVALFNSPDPARA